MSEPGSGDKRVLIKTKASASASPVVAQPDEAWRWLGWFGLVLAAAGLTDLALVFVPANFGNAEWEFGTVAQVISGLPLATMGLAALLGAGMALGARWLQFTMGVVLLLALLAVGGLLVMFLSHVPMALVAVEEPALTGIKKAIAKTVALGTYFGIGYGAAGFWALLTSLRGRR